MNKTRHWISFWISFWILTSLAWSFNAGAQETVTIQGILKERGTKTPLTGFSLFLLPSKLKATTDENGKFIVENAPAGEATWIINAAGYLKLERRDYLDSTRPSPLVREFYLEKDNYTVYETTVFGKGDRRDDTKRSIKASEFATLPGSGGDPIKSVQNLPGVNRPAPLQSQVIIQGSAPQDTRYEIDGHEVPIIFHFGGFSSVVTPEALDRVDYLSAGFGPEEGFTTSGIVGVYTRKPKRDRFQGFAFVDLLNAGAMIEGSIGESSSYLLGLRQSYVGFFLKKAAEKSEDFNLTVVPEFRDLTAIYDTELTPRDHLKLVTVGSQDSLEFLLAQPVNQDPAFRGKFTTRTSFFRIIPQLTHQHGESLTSRLSLGLGRDWLRFDTSDNYFFLNTYSLTTRGEVEKKWNENWISQFGFDNMYSWANVDFLFRDAYSQGGIFNPFSTGARKQANVSTEISDIAIYWRNEIRLGDTPWTVLPSIRGEYFPRIHDTVPLPRLGLRYKLSESFLLRGNLGYYAQEPLPQETDPTVGNPELKSLRAWHYSLGAEKDFREGGSRGFILSAGPFYKNLTQLVAVSSGSVVRNGATVSENYTNDYRGKVYGAESLLRAEFAPFTGWLSYTLSKSTRQLGNSAYYPFAYDQTHLLTAIGAYDLGKNWKIGTRLRYATGNPSTPVSSANFDSDYDVYIPLRGALYSERISPFAQLDLRIDKKWIDDTTIFSIYLDIQNLTNRKNPEQVQYAYDYSTKTVVSGLPVIPTLGAKLEF